MQASESWVDKGASQSSHAATKEGSVNTGSETVGVDEDMGQKLWREDCRCGGDEKVGMG